MRGKAIAARLLQFGTEVTRLASRGRNDGRCRIYRVNSLYEQLLHDILVVSVPLSEQTRNLVDHRFMPDRALLAPAGPEPTPRHCCARPYPGDPGPHWM